MGRLVGYPVHRRGSTPAPVVHAGSVKRVAELRCYVPFQLEGHGVGCGISELAATS